MKRIISCVCILMAVAMGCTKAQVAPSSDSPSEERAMAWPKDWSKHLGRTVTVEGRAANAKLGALLLETGDDARAIWIDGREAWPEGYYPERDKGKRLRVTGIVIQRDDLPAFIQKPNEPVPQGIPVQTEEDLKKARHRFLLKDAKWVVLD